MESANLEEFLKHLWPLQFPFVLFRLPDTQDIHCFYQKDNTLHQTENLDIEGFVIAPFLNSGAITYIPTTHKQLFQQPKKKAKSHPVRPAQEDSLKGSFIALIEKAKQAIAKKDLQKVVVSRDLQIQGKTNPCDLFSNLLGLYPTAMVSFWHHPKVGTWLGATPEKLVSITAGSLQTMALAGTQVFSEIAPPKWTVKEKEEQQLVTDQLKTDLESCYPKQPISISKPYTKRAGNLLHLCTDFKLNIATLDLKSLLQMIHPTPAVGGIPKGNALTFLAHNENYDRRFYAGYLGPIQSNQTHLFVNLRCAQWEENQLTLYIGAGITASSISENEWKETVRKAETFLNAL